MFFGPKYRIEIFSISVSDWLTIIVIKGGNLIDSSGDIAGISVHEKTVCQGCRAYYESQ